MPIAQKDIEKKLLSIIQMFLLELEAARAVQVISIDASLERDLGIGSLGKIELFHRIEEEFAIQLPERAVIDAESIRDLIKIIEQESVQHASTVKTPSFSPTLESKVLDLSMAETLVDVLRIYAATEPQRPHMYLQDERGEEQTIRYGTLVARAKNIAAGLCKHGIKPGETVAIMLPTSAEFFYAFAAILLAGAIAVPIYPPFRPSRIEEYAKREANILRNAEVRMLITVAANEMLSNILRTFVPSLKEVVTIKDLQASTSYLPNLISHPHDFALIQYTSGSTSDPKGVLLAHQNILANIRAIGQAVRIQSNDVIVSWLPLYHDMGLMNWLAALYFGIPITILSPLAFLTRPERWLWAIHYHRATLSGGPNFAYELCARKINLRNLEGLDSSSWRYAFNGAEAINPKTLVRFNKNFASFGFKVESFAPVYGLAESTVGLTLPPTRRYPLIDKIQRKNFEYEKAMPASEDDKNILEFVACGEALPGHAIRIVDDQGQLVLDRMVGNIQFKGPSSMQGYFRNSTATQKTYHHGWWDTGDLGYLVGKELFVTGRKKDLIIKAGRNLHPEAIEELVNQIQGIRKGCVIAFGINDAASGTEKLIVVAETYPCSNEIKQQIRATIIDKMVSTLGVPPDAVDLVPAQTVPKTSSGKLQRSACKQAYIEGTLAKPPLSTKLQILKLAVISVGKKAYYWCALLGKLLYSIYIGIILVLTLPWIWLSTFIVSRHTAATVCKHWARNFCRVAFCPVKIEGKTHLQSKTPMVFVANHTSHCDFVFLLGLLPVGTIFIAKKELLRIPVISTFLKKLGFITIERMDFTKSLASKERIEHALQEGNSIAIFPEGTFTYRSGLRPFKLGAFAIAVETQTAICSIALHGTRTIFRDGDVLIKPGKVKITIGSPLEPTGKDWDEIIRLHTTVRSFIAKHCGEPVIDVIVAGPEPTL